MAFSNLWPLAFLVAIPIIIILYILKPKGQDVEISSNVLWKRLFRNNRSKTIFEKFVHEILMYLEIVAALLLVLGLMSPYFKSGNAHDGNVLFIIDNTLSMQHKDKNGRTRLELAKDSAMAYAESTDGTVTVISCSDRPEILIARSTEKGKIKSAIASVEATDKEGDLAEAQNVISTFDADSVIVFSDGNGAEGADTLHKAYGAEERFFGGPSGNVSLDFVAVQEKDGVADVSARFTNFSDSAVTVDVTLYDNNDKVLGIISKPAEAGRSASVLFEGIRADMPYVKAEISNIVFASGISDSLIADNTSYSVRKEAGDMSGILIGDGNAFLEKAYKAVTGNDIVKAANAGGIASGNFEYAIFDAGFEPDTPATDSMIFGIGKDGNEELSNVVIDVKECELTEGLGEFKIGANKVKCFDVPENAKSFMEAGDKCVGYYGVVDGVKIIRVGFDIRETDFAVQAQFPVFMAYSMRYMSEMGILIQNDYTAGEAVRISPGTDVDFGSLKLSTEKAGIFEVGKGEYYAVHPNADGFDGRAVADNVEGSGGSGSMVARKGIRRAILLIAILLLIAEFLIFAKKMNYRGVFYTVLRVVITLLVILSLIELHIPKRSRNVTTVFLVDVSKSNEINREDMEAYLRKNLNEMPKRNSYAIVTFGRKAVIDQFVTDENMFMGIGAEPDISATDFEDAIGRAVSLIPDDSNGRIVILTDGRETSGDIQNAAAMVTASSVSVEAYGYEALSGQDSFVKNVDMPSVLHPGDKYYMDVAVESNYETDATIIIRSGEKLVSKETVHLAKGDNRFVFEENVSSENVESFNVSVEAPGDTVSENNMYSIFAEVESSPKVLVLYGKREDYTPYEQLLSDINANAVFKDASSAPEDLMGMLEYKAIILENVYISELPQGFLDNISAYVKDYGGGFAAFGGEDSFMLGGYNDTVIEEVLPTNMELRGTAEIPSTAIIMVIDHSGSMSSPAGKGATYLDVAVESAKRGADNLRAEDYLGVLAFDDRYDWYVKPQNVTDKEEIKKKINRITEGGGTTIEPAIIEAYNKVIGLDADVKHIILLTDGYGESSNYDNTVKKLKGSGVTLSTVAVGPDSDKQLMKRLATQCNGRFYYADANTDLPRIFAEEVFLGGDTYIKNGDYPLSVASSHDITKNLFTDGWYNIGGYIAASEKSGATGVITTEEGDPILTVWQYGLGRTLSYNTDVDNGWTAAYAGTSDYAQLHKRIIDYLSGSPSIGDDKVDVRTVDGKTEVTYTTGTYADTTDITALYTAPDGTTGEVRLTARKPGVYTATLPSEEMGIYHINVRREDEGTVSGSFTTATAVQYSDEYRFDVTDEEFRAFIDTYGKWLDKDEYLWTKIDNNIKGSYNLTDVLLAIAIVLFILDIAGRRFGFEPVLPKRRKKEAVPAGGMIKVTDGAADGIIGNMAGTGNMANAGNDAAAGIKPVKKKKSKTEKKPAPEQLDTAALLQKKRDRNL